jgi:hypothetical protein
VLVLSLAVQAKLELLCTEELLELLLSLAEDEETPLLELLPEEDELSLLLSPPDEDIATSELLLGVSSSLPDEQEKASTIASPKAAVSASL